MHSFRVLIVEDEINTAERLSKMVHTCGDQFSIIGICGSIESTVNWLRSNSIPDLILMDIELSDGISFEIFNHLVIKLPVIFTTAYDNHALEAFKNNAIDYLLKPIKENELKAALLKFEDHKKILDENQLMHLLKTFNLPEPKKYIERFKIQIGQQLKILMINEVAYFYIRNKIVYLITFSGDKHMIDFNLDELENKLNPDEFFRINRQFIINIKSIKKMTSYTKSRVKILLSPLPEADLEVLTSVERSAQFKKWLEGI